MKIKIKQALLVCRYCIYPVLLGYDTYLYSLYITILFLSDRSQPLSVTITKCRVRAVAGCSCM